MGMSAESVVGLDDLMSQGLALENPALEDLLVDNPVLDDWAEFEAAWVDDEFAAIVEANFGSQPPEPPEPPVPAGEPPTPRTHSKWLDVNPRCIRRPHTVGVRKERSPPSVAGDHHQH